MRRSPDSHHALEVLVSGSETAAARAPIIFVHGTGHAAWCWQNFASYFAAAGFTTYAVSLRGHGASLGADRLPSTSIADYVADVRSVAEPLEAPSILIGHSLGGLVVQKYLQQFPAAAAVLLAPSPVTGMLRANWQIAFRKPLAVGRALMRRDFAALYDSPQLVHELLFLSTTPRAHVEKYALHIGPESFRAALEMLLPLRGRRSFDCPVLVVGGTEDRIVPLRHAVKTANALGATMAVMEDAAHELMLDLGWERVADRIRDWLERIACACVNDAAQSSPRAGVTHALPGRTASASASRVGAHARY